MQRMERATFLKYLINHAVHIDVWDADSLVLVGFCRLPLRVG